MTDVQNRIAALSAEQRALLESRLANVAATRGAAQREPIQPRDQTRPTPLSFAQQREWALERFRPSNNIIGALRLEGDVDLELLGRVMTEVTARHEVLRSTVEMVDRTPVQVVHPVTPVPVGVVDLSHLNHDQQRAEMRRHYDAEVMRPFPQDQAQRLRATVLRLAPTTYIALLIVHHASSDGWSTAIIIRDAAEQYRALRLGKEAKLPPLPIQYGDFAAWQREHLGDDRIQSDLKYWKKELADIPPRLELPTDRPHPVRRTFDASQHGVSMPREDAITLQRFARDEGVSLSMLLLAAASAMLYRYTGQDDLVLGSAISGRSHTETEQLIGCFANALPLRMKVSRTQTLRELLHQARDVSSAAFAHQDVPFDLLIDELAPKETSQTPLIQMMINVVTSPGNFFRSVGQAMEMPNVRITVEPVELGPVAVDLILIVQASAEAVEVQWHYSTELFDAQTVVRLAEQFDHVRKQIISNPDRRVGDVDLLDTGAPVDTVRTVRPEETSQELIELFQHQVVLAPDAPAVICDGAATSYGELNQQANRLARQLQAFGVTADTPVAILLDRSPRLAAAILGVLKAGGAYVPVDPAFPAERISFMICDAAAPVLITTKELAPLADGASRSLTVLMDRLDQQPADGAADPPVAPGPVSTAYVVYTSGSTGRPKGVMIERRSLVAFAREVAARLQLGAGDRFLQFASPSFDVLAEELFPIWLTGGAVVFPPQQKGGAAIDLVAIAERDRVSVMELPAAYWHEWVRELDRTQRTLPPSLRLVIVGAERVLPERLAMWQQLGLPLMHVYGITETTVSSTFFRLAPDSPAADRQHLPIGTALPSARLRILDSELRPVPAGAVGELYIGGNSLARGYQGRPGMTAERFVADPDPAHPGERAYRTGDLVRRRVDGNLEFLSRADAQIKIRGFRVEPTEIESAICRHPQIADAAVTVHETAPDDRRLIAYLVPQARTRPNITDMRRFLAREIPHYLVPAAFVTIDKLPLTPNGKVDFDRLPEPPDERPELDEELVPPRTPLERKLADIVTAVLGITLVGANDNFFELGGDSILAIQVAAHAQEEGIPLSPLDLFEHPTIALLAELADGKETADADQPADATQQPGDGTGQADGTGLPDAASSEPAPADFPLARVDQAQLDTLLSSMAAANADIEAPEGGEQNVSAPASGFRAFLILWCGQLVSLIGSFLASFALGVQIYQLTGSAAKLGIVYACALAPSILVSPIAGSLVDRWGRRRSLVVSNTGAMLISLVLALLLVTHSFAVWNIYLVTIVGSVLRALQVPAFGSTVPLLVPKQHIGRANGLLQLATSASQVMAPIIAGFLLLEIKLQGVILINSVSYGVAIITLLLIRIPAPRNEDGTAGAEPATLLGSFAQGWRYVTARRGLVSLMILFAALCFCCGLVDVLYVPVVLAFASTGALGTVLTVGGVGMVAGSIAMGAWGGPRRRTSGVAGFSLLLGSAVIFGALRPSVPLIAVAAFIFLGSTAIIEGCYMSIWQTKIEPRMLGRVLALQNMVTMAPQVLSYLLAGLIAAAIFQPQVGRHQVRSHFFATLVGTGQNRGFALTMLFAGLLILVIGVWGYVTPRISRLEDRLPDEVDASPEPIADRV